MIDGVTDPFCNETRKMPVLTLGGHVATKSAR
jgi:hypothetical protein